MPGRGAKMSGRLLGMALATTTGVARRGWFIPHRYAQSIPAAGDNPPYAPLLKILDANKLAFPERYCGQRRLYDHMESCFAHSKGPGRQSYNRLAG